MFRFLVVFGRFIYFFFCKSMTSFHVIGEVMHFGMFYRDHVSLYIWVLTYGRYKKRVFFFKFWREVKFTNVCSLLKIFSALSQCCQVWLLNERFWERGHFVVGDREELEEPERQKKKAGRISELRRRKERNPHSVIGTVAKPGYKILLIHHLWHSNLCPQGRATPYSILFVCRTEFRWNVFVCLLTGGLFRNILNNEIEVHL